MNIRLGDLEKLRTNPNAYYETSDIRMKRSKFMRWQDTIGYYHKGKDFDYLEQYITMSFGKMADNAANRRDLKKFIGYLHDYDEDYRKLKSEKLEYKKNMAFALPNDVELKSQVPRIDLNIDEDGYSAYYFMRERGDWENELRFPILQNCIADYFGCDTQVVKVGVYILEESKHFNQTYTQDELDEAANELHDIIKEIVKGKV